ncbi:MULTISPECIES: YqgE/AlgH family protein [Chryseobacterium]|jgi:putative transcriptional regulator|uniref:Transcriptional regulator n=1 Tax=Chryseobacterium indoltheticum TaxID=254 RepID=A0A381FNF8_9FLAO|nr:MULTISPECIES: YqgE/AlgH family protein [Chryseobacterium]AZA62552.1 YqgE/AlgH family protein [Chryseobacterium indoltheticum]AZA75418.1 YqgE/AlgH family protein [Chryseobacterium indoltheticum]MDF2832472.1 YqgE/AlgH family protein [Chryseobacterium indoltheticum]MDQ8143116.1 YqgE/AlgH family protein [Chryseobacterium sp. CFS15]QQQ27842.1 YqgE/AlgH family protein [Chryseobacterium indoltheticum]
MNYSYKGKILISTPDISGDIFSRSVVLIIDHTEDGAFGLILNKKNSKMSNRFKNFFDFDIEVYDGGPVENDKVFFIIKGKKVTENFTAINDEYYLTEDIELIINAVLQNEISIQDVKIFSGYSGWSASQLENEVLQKVWTVVDVYNLDYTLPNDHTLWKSIMQNLGGEFLLWANAPEDISLN